MKLLIEPRVEYETYNLKYPIGIKAQVKQLLGFTLKKGEYSDHSFKGRCKIEDVVIEGDLELGKKIPELMVGDYLLIGVIPIKELEPGKFQCALDDYERSD